MIVTGCATGSARAPAARRAPGRGYDLVVVADGHAPSERSGADSAGSIGRPGRRVRGRAVAGVGSGAPEGAAELTPCLIAEMSKVSLILSETRKPPVSSAAFQVRPQSERRISALPSKPTRSLPKGSFAAPLNSRSMVTGRVVPRMVRSPVMR
ncbi:hypothetical protein SGRIM128S_07406 [Streptomyces griseomycini]